MRTKLSELSLLQVKYERKRIYQNRDDKMECWNTSVKEYIKIGMIRWNVVILSIYNSDFNFWLNSSSSSTWNQMDDDRQILLRNRKSLTPRIPEWITEKFNIILMSDLIFDAVWESFRKHAYAGAKYAHKITMRILTKPTHTAFIHAINGLLIYHIDYWEIELVQYYKSVIVDFH